ncbi:short-chain dehydrogenase [Vagococcus penaei]|uniref:SDR family NAD(P)-dependent oxidoreductase n=1 Tax=Vagococcus penaei TaxID=633807 RepID=UPI0009844E7C|nr:SDR family oxidoreductase [Vagococcus penaei]RSU00835.1 short-chain dehydrogenase [Vagococcus penaei]
MKKVFQTIQNKTVLITGASSGLGENIAYEAIKQGANVILCARRDNELQRVAQKCRQIGSGEVETFVLDVADYQSCQHLLSQLDGQQTTVDVLVNCAGFGVFKSFVDTPEETIRQMFEVNVLGLMHLTQQIALRMIHDGSGHIINVASQAGKTATPKSSVYSATKFAVIGFSNALRLELKPLGIAVTTVNPGPIKTNFFEIADPTGSYLKNLGSLAIQPDVLARRIVRLMGSYRRELNAPLMMEIGSKGYQLFPKVGDFLTSTLFNKK